MTDEPDKSVETPEEQADIFARLAEPFPASCIEWLPKKIKKPDNRDVNSRGYGTSTALALCYIDARSVMARLDEVLTPRNWRDSYRVEGNRTICRLEILLNTGAGPQWVAKEDASGDSAVEAEKGGVSGAFKRAAVKWGIGRYLYDVDEVWAECEVRLSGQGDRAKVYHNGWTDKGKDQLAMAMDRAPGPRSTGKPPSIDSLLDKIDNAGKQSELHDIYDEHWAAVPLDYRAEVLRALDRRKAQLNDRRDRGDDNQRDQDDRGDNGRDDDNGGR